MFIAINSDVIAQCKLNYSNFSLVFEDDFKYTSTSAFTTNNANWRFDYPWGKNLYGNWNEDQYYDQSQVSILPLSTSPDGVLRLTAQKLTTPITYSFTDNTFNLTKFKSLIPWLPIPQESSAYNSIKFVI